MALAAVRICRPDQRAEYTIWCAGSESGRGMTTGWENVDLNQAVLDTAKALIEIPSVSADNNAAVIDFLADRAAGQGWVTERLTYRDAEGVQKHCLVARAGQGPGGVAFLSHTDTVPGLEEWEPFAPRVADGRLYGRGSCDMKGPLAAFVCAVSDIPAVQLRSPVYMTFSADEEVGHVGAAWIIEHSELLAGASVEGGIVTEPTGMVPVYANKGGAFMSVTARGIAAHSSTERGDSANFRIAPFLAEMAELKTRFMTDPKFRNEEFDPPTNGFNMTITDFGCATNVTAERCECRLSVRSMPKSGFEEAVAIILERAQAYGFDLRNHEIPYFYGNKDSRFTSLLCEIAGTAEAVTVPYGTEAAHYQPVVDSIVWGPGDIAQAHTVNEFIELEQLQAGYEQYGELVRRLCL